MGADILVIVPTHGHLNYARNAVASLMRPARPTELKIDYVVVDDASSGWDCQDWSTWPNPGCAKIRFDQHGGLTRSWNAGLRFAAEHRARYAVCTNSDVLFSNDCFAPLIAALETGLDLVGPVTNAPGHALWQHAALYCALPRSFFDDDNIENVAQQLALGTVKAIEAPINGFFMMATTEQWWRGASSTTDVFDPRFPLEHNEAELQERWRAAGYRIGYVPRSYIFHYRSVSRPEGLEGPVGIGAFRPTWHRNESV